MKAATAAGALLALIHLFSPPVAYAAPNDYVRMPTVVAGEREVDFKWGAARLRDGGSATATSLGLGLGATSFWFTELYAKWHRDPGSAGGFDAWEWENRFQLLETGRYPIDLGFLLEIERPKARAEGYELTYGPLLQSEWQAWQGNLNLLFQRHVRASETFETELLYQWQAKYRGAHAIGWGAQGFGSLGRWDRWSPSSEQQHQLGPALFGKVRVGAGKAINYNAALLFGVTHATPRSAFRVQAEFEF